MKIVIGILIGISLVFAFQKIMDDQKSPVEKMETVEAKGDSPAAMPADFLVFYTQFHSDSLFQMEHINFPLEGLPQYADSTLLVNKNFKWEKEDWRMHKNLDARKEDFSQNLSMVSDGLIFELIPAGDAKLNLYIERRFLKTNGDWRLIYYAGPNRR